MALPGVGKLSLNDIATEIYGLPPYNQSLRTMSAFAGFASPDNVSEFYNYNYNCIVLGYGSAVNYASTVDHYDYYWPLNRIGHDYGVIISVNIPYTLSAGYHTYLYYSENSTSVWNTIDSVSYGSISGTATISNIQYTDVIRLRIRIMYHGGNTGHCDMATGTFYSGGPGTITSDITTINAYWA
jgi:hypothetical protein